MTNAERRLYGEGNTKKEKRQKIDIAICLKREEKNISQHKKNKPFGVFAKDLQQQVERIIEQTKINHRRNEKLSGPSH